jgi:hypothetical protein
VAGGERPIARAMILAGDVVLWLACRRPKRRKTSEIVTMMDMMIRMIIIQVWSVNGLVLV